MPNIKSAKKRMRTDERNRQRNMSIRSRMKTYVKGALTAIESKDPNEINKVLRQALSEVDRAATKGVIHPNSAARKKSMLQRRAAAATK